MIKGKLKVNWFSSDNIRNIDSELPLDDFKTIDPFYDALEEYMLEMGFVLWDDEIEIEKEIIIGGFHEIRYNCATVRGVRRKDKFIVNSIGIAYHHIKNDTMNDLDKLSELLNYFKSRANRKDEDFSRNAKHVKEMIDKLHKTGKKNFK